MAMMPASFFLVRRPLSRDMRAPCEKPAMTSFPSGVGYFSVISSMKRSISARDSTTDSWTGGHPSNHVHPMAIPGYGSNGFGAFGKTKRQPPAGSNIGARSDRKSTRLNSSHGYISYAVFCLKKKK